LGAQKKKQLQKEIAAKHRECNREKGGEQGGQTEAQSKIPQRQIPSIAARPVFSPGLRGGGSGHDHLF